MTNTVIIAPGKDYEREVEVKAPQGRNARKEFNPLLAFVMNLSGDSADPGKMLSKAIMDPNYEDIYVPLALGLNDKEGLKWLGVHGEPMEIFTAFMEGVQIIMGTDVERDEVVEALKK